MNEEDPPFASGANGGQVDRESRLYNYYNIYKLTSDRMYGPLDAGS
jgi:hypothetical protein